MWGEGKTSITGMLFIFPELKKVPKNIPPDIVKLDLSYNKINQLRPKEFEDVHELRKLNLSSNGIEFIDPGKFHRIAL